MFCSNCGQELQDNTEICTNCGFNLNGEKKKKSKKGLIIGLVGVVVVLVVIIGVLVFQLLDNNDKKAPAESPKVQQEPKVTQQPTKEPEQNEKISIDDCDILFAGKTFDSLTDVKFTVYYEDTKLILDEDYMASLKSNDTDKGKASFLINGLEDYEGTAIIDVTYTMKNDKVILEIDDDMLDKDIVAETDDEETTDSKDYAKRQAEKAALVITTPEEFNLFIQNISNYNEKLVVLGNDIVFDGVTMNNYTMPNKEFNGVFDGCGYSISGILLSSHEEYGKQSIFNTNKGTIKNLNITNCNITGTTVGSKVAPIAYVNKGIIENCHVRDINLSSDGSVCGLVYSNSGSILNCSFVDDMLDATGSSYIDTQGGGTKMVEVAGLVCHNSGEISNSCCITNINSVGKRAEIGGVICKTQGTSSAKQTVQNCYFANQITYNTDKVEAVGGIAAEGSWDAVFSNCYYAAGTTLLNVQNAATSVVINNCNAMEDADMQTESFANTLNSNRGQNTEWAEWRIQEGCAYPLPYKELK